MLDDMVALSSIVVLLLFASLTSAQSNGSYPVVPSLALLPTITWIDATTLKFVFPDGQTDKTHLRPADPVGDLLDRVPCLFEGVLEGEHSSSIAVSGCQADDVVDVVIYTEHLPGQSMFKIKNGTTQQVEIISDNKRNDLEQPRRIIKRGVLLDDDEDYDYDYDDIGLDYGEAIPEPLPFYVFDVRLAFEENFERRAGTEIQARQMIVRIFTFGKVHLKHSSLGTSIRMKAQGPILKIPNEFWKPGGKKAKDLKASKKYKLQYDDHVPITFFCGNNDGKNIRVRGSSYKRKACDKAKGVSLVAFDDDIQAMAQTWGHETGHWMGFMHDLRVDNRDGTRCEGTGLMSNASRSGGRPSKWSKCSKERLKTWLSKPQNNCIRKDEELFQLKYSFDCLNWKADLQSEGCNRPVNVLHGKWFCSDDGVICSLNCNVGYKISHPSNKTSARCFKNAWMDNLEEFSCVCDTDFKPPYGSLNCSGSTCDLVCDSGYDSCALRTPTSLRCTDNTWNLNLSTIACDRQCHLPMFAPNLGTWEFHETGCGVHLTCPRGYCPSNVEQTIFQENQNEWTIPLDSFSCLKVSAGIQWTNDADWGEMTGGKECNPQIRASTQAKDARWDTICRVKYKGCWQTGWIDSWNSQCYIANNKWWTKSSNFQRLVNPGNLVEIKWKSWKRNNVLNPLSLNLPYPRNLVFGSARCNYLVARYYDNGALGLGLSNVKLFGAQVTKSDGYLYYAGFKDWHWDSDEYDILTTVT